MAEITRQDLIDDDALKAPGILTEEFQKLLNKLDDVVNKSKEYVSSFSGSDSSTVKLRESTAGLSDEQRVLAQVQQQIATLTAKQSDAYQEQIQVVNTLKQSFKDKAALGEQETQSVTRENSSRNQLLAALNSNRQAYSNLRSEQERNSPTGQKLLKTIQDQDKSFKDLSKSMGDNKVLVGGYRSEIEELLEKFTRVGGETGELAERTSTFGKNLVSLVLSPAGLAIAAIGAAIGLTKASLDVFYEDSIQGQDKLNSSFNSWKAIVAIIKDSMFDLGKETSSWVEKAVQGFSAFVAFAFKGAEGVAELAVKEDKLNAVSELQNEIKKEEIRLTVEVSKIELEKQDELYIARDKANEQLEIRYEALLKAKTLLGESISLQLTGINNEILLQQKAISVNTTKSVVGLTANQILAQSNELGRVNYEQVEKLAQLEVKRNQILEQRFSGQRRVQALENTIVDEAIKKQVEYEKTLISSEEKGYVERAKTDKAYWDRILQNQSNSFELRNEAIDQNIGNESVILDFEKTQAIRAEKEKFVALISLTKEAHDRINKEAAGDLDKRAELERKEKEKIVEDDKTFNQVRENINKEYDQKDRASLEKGLNEKLKLIKEYKLRQLGIEKQIGEQIYNTIVSVFNNAYDAAGQRIEKQLSDLEEWHQRELQLAGDNADAKIKIDKQFTEQQKALQKEQADLKRKQAIFDKAAAAIEVAFKTGIAVMEAVALSPETFGQPWAGVALALGALQEVAILSKPIPSYAIGTKDHPGGLAQIHPNELLEMPSGRFSMSPDSASIVDLPQHTKVFTSTETTRMLALAGLSVPEKLDKSYGYNDRLIVKELKQTNSLLAKKTQTSILADGLAVVEVYKNNEGLVKKIRSNVMIG